MSNQLPTDNLDSAAAPPSAPRREIQTDLIYHVAELNEQEALALAQARLRRGDNPLSIVEDCQVGMQRVGERYEQGQYYLSGLIMAGEIFREVMELTRPAIELQVSGAESGRVLLGTVRGDIHDIGKNIQSVLLSCYGFTVYDLGVDVAPDTFVAQAAKIKPNVIGLSGLLSSSYDAMRNTVALFRCDPDPILANVPIVIGGGTINEQVHQYVDADYWIVNAMDGVRLCQRLLVNKNAV
jgi:methanogenic corrinoid protein MtbC1